MGHKIVYNACYGGYGLSHEAMNMLRQRGYNYDDYDMRYKVPRHNKDLVEVVEALGPSANGICAELAVCELPEGCDVYRIDDYDGLETIQCPEDMNWITIP